MFGSQGRGHHGLTIPLEPRALPVVHPVAAPELLHHFVGHRILGPRRAQLALDQTSELLVVQGASIAMGGSEAGL